MSWKPDVDTLPEFDISFKGTHFELITEKKPYKDKETGEEGHAFYYPGFTFIIKTVRDPFPKLIRYYFPTVILGIFLWSTFDVAEFADRLANLSICLLSYIALMD